MTGVGGLYQGTVNTTWSGEKCLAWNDENYDTAYRGLYPHNFCRNPGPPATAPILVPWCYTANSKKVWETCENIRKCGACDIGKDPLLSSSVPVGQY